MAAVIFRRQSKIGSIVVDALISDSTQMSSEVPQYPIENGTVISDHVTWAPITVSMNCFVSNTPINSGYLVNRISTVYEDLKDLWLKGEFVNLVTGLEVYKNMVITNVTIPREEGTSDALYFSVDFQEVRVVETLEAPMQDLKSDVVDQAASGVSSGNQETRPPTDQEVFDGSAMVRLADGEKVSNYDFATKQAIVPLPFGN